MENKLEDRPIIGIAGLSPAPGVESDTWGRYLQWVMEVNLPMYLTLPGRTGIDRYTIVKENAEYPSQLSLVHTENIRFVLESLKDPRRIGITGDTVTWVKRRVTVYIWNTRYRLIRSFRSQPFGTPPEENTKIENAPFLHLESYHLHQEGRDRYFKWLNDVGFSSFMPLLMTLPGIKGYDCYQNVNYPGLAEAREWDYPGFLSAVYFQDKTAFENYTKSPELLAFQKAIHSVFANGLNLKWYVQYQLMKSWRK